MDRFSLKIAKYKSGASLNQLLRHCTREHMPKNADPSRTHRNKVQGDWRTGAFLTRRTNGVAAIEVLLSASPEWYGYDDSSTGWSELKHETRIFFEQRFGGAETASADHQDETTGHFHLLFSPTQLGTSAKSLIGGPKYMLNILQSDFQRQVGVRFGLTRVERSVPCHADIKDLYADISKRMKGDRWRFVALERLLHLEYIASMATDEQRLRAKDMMRLDAKAALDRLQIDDDESEDDEDWSQSAGRH